MKLKLIKNIHGFPAGLISEGTPYYDKVMKEERIYFRIPGQCVVMSVRWCDVEIID